MLTRVGLATAAAVVFAGSLFAVVARTIPLKDVLAAEQFILVATIESIDERKLESSIAVRRELKGKAPFSQLTVKLEGDASARREKQSAKLLERIAPNIELIVFGSIRGKVTTLFAYSNGTWFRIVGADPASSEFAFAHMEPYLRRTFKATTAELKQTVIDGLSGKSPPPAPDPNEPPGLGPALPKKTGGP